MLQPTLSIQTVYIRESDREAAVRLGTQLYALLSRPPADPLAYGAGIPVLSGVAAQHVNVHAARDVVLIPVLGKTTFQTARDNALEKINEWCRFVGTDHVLPLPLSGMWRDGESDLPGKALLTMLSDADDSLRATVDEIVLAVTRLLDDQGAVQLFISHAKRDLEATDGAAKQIHEYIVNDTTGKAFFDVTDLHAGKSLTKQIDAAAGRGVLVVVRGDAYSSRAWCQQELLTAKQHGVPTLTVDMLKDGEQRASPYGGNGPTLRWQGDPSAVASRAMVEWLRATHFARDAQRIKEAAGLPDSTLILSHAPELLDLAQGPLPRGETQLVLHPDPELAVRERQVLQAAYPRLQLVTPTTAFRRLLSRGGRGTAVSPLQGLQVAMSLSDNPDAGGPEGYTSNHFHDATVYIARSLISAGAAIAYGGNFRNMQEEREQEFTTLLTELISSYNQSAQEPADYLHSYLEARVDPEDVPELPIRLHSMTIREDIAVEPLLPYPVDETRPGALYVSDMRRNMALQTDARVVIGGKAEPRTENNPSGYGGRFPGIVEEAWRTLEAGKPLYAVGGLGGAAQIVVELLEGEGEIPERLRDETWLDSEQFRNHAAAIEADPVRVEMGLPRRMEDIGDAIRELSGGFLKDDKTAIAWNGLDLEENRALFRSCDPVMIASLVLKGLLRVTQAAGEGKLQIELVHGSVTTASGLDAIAIATFEGVPMGGAGAALDRALGGGASISQAQGKSLLALPASEIDANYLYMASLGPAYNADDIAQAASEAAFATTQQAHRHGFQRLGVVTFGGSFGSLNEAVDAMLEGFRDLAGHCGLVWFETDKGRFDTLNKLLSARDEIKVTTRDANAPEQAQARAAHKETLILQVAHDGKQLLATAVPPAGTGVASVQSWPASIDDMAELGVGSGPDARTTPPLHELETRGQVLAEHLLGENAEEILSRCSDTGLTVIHDVASSRLPFEMMNANGIRPAARTGFSRRLAVSGMPASRLFAAPVRSGALGVVLIVNPTGDLPSAEDEALAVKGALAQQDHIHLEVLEGKQATKDAVLEALQSYEVLHYCGHAYYDGPGENESGLELADGKLTLREIADLSSVPRVVFFNACESGRVRGSFTTESSAFAEMVLKSGVEAYVGTYWQVSDIAAADFATGVYARLADGKHLEQAVMESRADLLKVEEADWANYILYGDGRFTLSASPESQS